MLLPSAGRSLPDHNLFPRATSIRQLHSIFFRSHSSDVGDDVRITAITAMVSPLQMLTMILKHLRCVTPDQPRRWPLATPAFRLPTRRFRRRLAYVFNWLHTNDLA